MKNLGEFLNHNPRYSFDIIEHIELGAVIDGAKRRFLAMAQSIGQPLSTTVWGDRHAELCAVTANVPAYQKIDWNDPAYPANVPLMDKEVLRQRGDAYLATDVDRERLWHRPTSGTSGRPVTLHYSPDYCSEFHYFAVAAALLHAGLFESSLGKSAIYCLALIDRPDLADRIWLDPSELTGATLRLAFDCADPGCIADIVAVVREHQPAVISLKPSILELLLAQAPDCAWAAGLVAIVSGGSQLSVALKLDAAERLAVPLIDAYGMTEVGAIASSCRLGELHVHEGQVILEVLQTDGSLGRTGQGELVVTGFRNAAMPILRYRTGDGGELLERACRCGLNGRVIRNLEGRLAPLFSKPDGQRFAPTALDRLQRQFPIREFQVSQARDGSVDLAVEWIEGSVGCDQRLAEAAQKLIGPAVPLHISVKQFSLGDKFQRYRILDE